MYSQGTARWMSKDPIELDGESTNRYQYSRSQPTVLNDPSGLYIGPGIPRPIDPGAFEIPWPKPTFPLLPARNRDTILGFNTCWCPPSTKKDRQRPIPGLDALPPGFIPPGPPPGSHTHYLPAPGVPIGGGGAGPCIIVVIKCPNGIAVYHFRPANDASWQLGYNDWTGCEAIIWIKQHLFCKCRA